MGSSFHKFNKFRTYRDISILFEDLTSVETPSPMGGCVGGWVGLGEISKNQINLDLIKIFEFCLKVDICGDSPTHEWEGGWMGGLMGGFR